MAERAILTCNESGQARSNRCAKYSAVREYRQGNVFCIVRATNASRAGRLLR